MRLDKYLKVSRLVKRRTLAKEVCDGGKVFVNNRVAKAGVEVKAGDEILLDFGRKQIKVKIVQIKDNVPAQQAADLYELISTEHKNPEGEKNYP